MSLFEFLMVLVSLIIGFGLAELLSGVARIIRHREEVKLYWIHSLFILIVFLALLQTWWEIWGVRETPTWSFLGLLMMLAGPIGLFLISHLIFPQPLKRADFRLFYYEKMSPVLWLAILTIVASATFRPLVLGTELFKMDNLSSFFLMATFISMTRISNPIFHGVMVVLVFVALLADVLLVNMLIQ